MLTVWMCAVLFAEVDPNPQTVIGCGPAAVAVAGRRLGHPVGTEELQVAFTGRVTGLHQPEDLRRALVRLGWHPHATHLNPRDPELALLPLIVSLRSQDAPETTTGHFVTLYGRTEPGVVVYDFPRPPRIVPIEALAPQWDGAGIYVLSTPAELPLVEPLWGYGRWGMIGASLLIGAWATWMAWRGTGPFTKPRADFFAAVALLLSQHGCSRESAGPLLSVERLKPTVVTGHGAVISARPGELIELQYRVRNESSQALAGLALGGCHCHVAKALPERLAPGEAAEFVLRVRVPEYGEREISVPIQTANGVPPLATVSATLSADVNPPALLAVPAPIVLTRVLGTDQPLQWSIRALEVGSREWLTSLRFPEEVPITTRRRVPGITRTAGQVSSEGPTPHDVTFDFDLASLPVGTHRGTAWLESADGEVVSRIPYTIHVLAPAAFIPAMVHLSPDKQTSIRVQVVPRVPAKTVVPLPIENPIDQELLGVERLGSEWPPTFHIKLRAVPAESQRVSVPFELGPGVQTELSVLVTPSVEGS